MIRKRDIVAFILLVLALFWVCFWLWGTPTAERDLAPDVLTYSIMNAAPATEQGCRQIVAFDGPPTAYSHDAWKTRITEYEHLRDVCTCEPPCEWGLDLVRLEYVRRGRTDFSIWGPKGMER